MGLPVVQTQPRQECADAERHLHVCIAKKADGLPLHVRLLNESNQISESPKKQHIQSLVLTNYAKFCLSGKPGLSPFMASLTTCKWPLFDTAKALNASPITDWGTHLLSLVVW